MLELSAYEPTVASLIRRLMWKELSRYCSSVRKQISEEMAEGTSCNGDGLAMLSTALAHEAMAFGMMGKHKQAARSMVKSITILSQMRRDYVDTHLAYLTLARTFARGADPIGERKAQVRALTAVISRRQAAFVACSLDSIAGTEENDGN